MSDQSQLHLLKRFMIVKKRREEICIEITIINAELNAYLVIITMNAHSKTILIEISIELSRILFISTMF